MSDLVIEETPPALPLSQWKPAVNPWLIALAVMSATFMEVLDTTIVNVALPHVAGSLSTVDEEATWVLTSYLVANAIILPATGWLSVRFGRKRFLMACIGVFTIASLLCGAATNLGMLILARILQGAGGGALQPISQAVLLESFPREKRGLAMAVFGLGIVTAPIIGPTLGGWLTDNYSWRWVFYVNLPVGILSLFLIQLFIEDPPYIKHAIRRSVDGIGFALLAIWVAAFQVILDKGQQDDWLASPFIRLLAVISVVGFAAFVWWELRVAHPLVNLRVLKNRNFGLGTGMMTVMGAVLYGSIALLPLYLQRLMGYSAFQSGLTISPRGFGSILGMIIIGRVIGLLDNRFMVAFGLALLAFSTNWLGNLSLEVGPENIVLPNIFNGFATAMIFVPLTTLTMGTLHNEQMGNAAGIFNLMRNLGGSMGIAMVTTFLSRGMQVHQANLVGKMTPYDLKYTEELSQISHALGQSLGHVTGQMAAVGVEAQRLMQQAALLSYVDNFRMMAFMALLCLPAMLLFKRPKHR